MNVIKLLLFFLLAPFYLFAQRDYTWCFGDSVRMKFVSGNLIPDSLSSLYAQEENASISDNAGNLLFYAGCKAFQNVVNFSIWDKYNNIMQNGDSLLGHTSVTNG